MRKPQIQTVTDNMDKQRTYAYWKGRYKLAVQHEFYFEALMIDYALIEDRIVSILYHSGVMPNRQTLKMQAKSTKTLLRNILVIYGDFKESNRVELTKLYGKIRVMLAILNWVENVEDDYKENNYLFTLKRQYESVDIGGLRETFDAIKQWSDYRDEIVHAALNKNLEDITDKVAVKVQEGFQYANYLDVQERIIRKGNAIRKAANLPI